MDFIGNDNVNIKNCNLKDYYYGMYFYNSEDNAVSKNMIQNTLFGIYTYQMDNTIFDGNQLSKNGYGFYLFTGGFLIKNV